MRTTVTLSDEIVKKTLAASKTKRLSEALETTLAEHFALKKRLALLDKLFNEPVPHNWKKIKRERRRRDWSS